MTELVSVGECLQAAQQAVFDHDNGVTTHQAEYGHTLHRAAATIEHLEAEVARLREVLGRQWAGMTLAELVRQAGERTHWTQAGVYDRWANDIEAALARPGDADEQ